MSTTSTPSAQQLRPLAEVVDIVSGFGFPKELQGNPKGDLPFFKVGDISIAWNRGQKNLTQAQHYLDQAEASSIRAKAFPKGTVVFAKIGEAIRLNRRAILGQPSIVDNNVMGLIPKEEVVDPTYLFYWSLMLRLGDISQATTVPSVRKSDVEQLSFPWLPIEQQKHIVAEIEKQFSRLDEAVDNLKRVKANLKRYKAAVLKAAVEGRLVETEAELARREGRNYETGEQLLQRILETRRSQWQGKGKYKEPAAPDTSGLPELPEGWVWGTWDQISNWVTYGFTRPMPHVEEGVPIVTAKHVIDGRIELYDTHKTPYLSYVELSDKDRPEPGDILITKDGTIGRAAVVPQHNGFCINQSVAVVWLRSCPIHRQFLLAIIESELVQKPVREKARGVAIKHLSITDFAKLSLPIAPMGEQQRIVTEVDRRLSLLHNSTAQLDASIQRSEFLRRSILAKAFSPDKATFRSEE